MFRCKAKQSIAAPLFASNLAKAFSAPRLVSNKRARTQLVPVTFLTIQSLSFFSFFQHQLVRQKTFFLSPQAVKLIIISDHLNFVSNIDFEVRSFRFFSFLSFSISLNSPQPALDQYKDAKL